MGEVLAVTGPVYLVIAIGWATTRGGLFARADMRIFGKFVLQLALPALLFTSLARRPVAEVLNPVFLAAYAGGSLAVAFAALLWARRVAGRSASASAMLAMGMTCSNSAFMGYPLALQWLGPPAGVALALVLVVENAVMLPLLLALADRKDGSAEPGRWRHTVATSLRGLLRNPMIIAIVLGLAFSVSGLAPPAPVQRAVDLFATSCGALALFVIGGSLVGLPLRGMLGDVAAIAAGKLLLHPLAVLALLVLLPPIDPALRTGALLMAAVPMFGIYPILAQKHGHDGMAAAAQLGTTVLSFFTLTALLWLLRSVPGWGG